MTNSDDVDEAIRELEKAYTIGFSQRDFEFNRNGSSEKDGPMNIDDVENEIKGIYSWFAKEAPGTLPREEGHLGSLWAIADRMYLEHAKTLTEDQVVTHYGYATLDERGWV